MSYYALWFANRLYTGGNVTILGGHGTGHSKQKHVKVHVFYSERFLRNNYFTVNEFGFSAQNCSSLTPYWALLNFCLWVWMKSEVHKTKVDTRDKLCDQIMDDIDSIKKVMMHSDEQHAMSLHDSQSAWLLTVEFWIMYCSG